MTAKRPRSPDLIPNPFIKKRNLEWSLDVPRADDEEEKEEKEEKVIPLGSDRPGPSLSAALESGAATHPDPAAHFFSHLARHTLSPYPSSAARLGDLEALFASNAGRREGAHFVVHQHDHPVAGPHYDLRLQVNGTSSVSWAVMYGLPGDANSARLNRNATETRVHCLWNHVVETASWHTGSLVIWDCGVYEVLEGRTGRTGRGGPEVDPDSGGEQREKEEDENEDVVGGSGLTEQEKLARAFGERKIRVRLHGAKLPRGYVLNLRLTKGEDAEGRRRSEKALAGPARKRRRRKAAGGKQQVVVETSSEDDDDDDDVVPDAGTGGATEPNITDVERELRELEDETVRTTNAYQGAENSVGSVHQRRWYMSLDREASGFVKGGKGQGWVLRREGGDGGEDEGGGRLRFPFYVRGPEVERSVVTGRRGDEVLRDEGVVGFVKRRGWKPVLN